MSQRIKKKWRCWIGLHHWRYAPYHGLGPWTGSRSCSCCDHWESLP